MVGVRKGLLGFLCAGPYTIHMCTVYSYTPKEPIGGWQVKGRGVEFEQFEHHHTSRTFWTKPLSKDHMLCGIF